MPLRRLAKKAEHLLRYRGHGPVAFIARESKARMICAIVEDFLHRPVEGMRILDIGSGNGDISRFFAARGNQVSGVDVDDKRKQKDDSFEFALVDSEKLPFEDATFDLVLSHHVIEHVSDQRLHLSEIKRVLKPGGACYLATPNRTSPIMRGHVGNQMVLRHHQMQPLFEECGFQVWEYSYDVMTRPDEFHGEKRYGRFIPPVLAERLRPLYPSHMFMLKPS